jgi:hypothetical protein
MSEPIDAQDLDIVTSARGGLRWVPKNEAERRRVRDLELQRRQVHVDHALGADSEYERMFGSNDQ